MAVIFGGNLCRLLPQHGGGQTEHYRPGSPLSMPYCRWDSKRMLTGVLFRYLADEKPITFIDQPLDE
jgi:hypothetical protein